jgi:hypothetical protein
MEPGSFLGSNSPLLLFVRSSGAVSQVCIVGGVVDVVRRHHLTVFNPVGRGFWDALLFA